MTKTLKFVAVVLAMCVVSTTYGQLTERFITVFEDMSVIETGPNPQEGACCARYSNMDPGPNGYQAFAPGGGIVADDDYVSELADPFPLTAFRFIGGVDTVGGVAFFDFTDGSLTDGFGVAFPGAGDFIWTITIGSPFLVPGAGDMIMTVDDAGMFGPATGGRMFLGDAGATIGSTVLGTALAMDFDNNFEMIPEPGSLVLLLSALFGFGVIRRK